jgi:hypothetical protein
MAERCCGGGAFLWKLCEGNLEGRLPLWGPWRIGKKALKMDNSSIGPPLGNVERGSSNTDFERWLKETLRMEL